jgi:hypothetical protein
LSNAESPLSTAYTVTGWKTDPARGIVSVFEKRNSITPKLDVERALKLRASFIDVRLDRDPEGSEDEFAKGYSKVGGPRDSQGRFYDLPLRNGVLTYEILGFVPTGRVHPVNGKALHRILFRSEESIVPSLDVEKALKAGCTSVSVGVNFELSEKEKQRLDREEEKLRRGEEEDSKFWDSIPEFSVED